ncbi:MAG: hypothetical protein GF364_17935 [Candidatus Lokiarchaeota archaeon]|nr:hypothetical protein [Candidatus Lokiarchaeota archaeon]
MRVRAPGRICLFGEHQDYLGLPIISAAINRYIYIEGVKIDEPFFKIEMPDINKTRQLSINADENLNYENNRDYLLSCLNILKRKSLDWGSLGYNIKIHGDIPINAGASSSSAMVIAWILFLSKIGNASFSSSEIAKMGYFAEVKEFNEAGGMMDHFTSAIGGLMFMETAPEFKHQNIKNYENNFKDSYILIDSLQKKDTVDDLKRTKSESIEAINKINGCYPKFNIRNTQLKKISPYLDDISIELRKKIVGTLMNRDLTIKALHILKMSESKILSENEKQSFGSLIYQHHKYLSEYIGISTPKIDRLVKLCMENGAKGAKINGSGFGGTLFAYCPKNRENLIEILKSEDVNIYPVDISMGAGEY